MTARTALLRVHDTLYTRLARPVIFRSPAQAAHKRLPGLLRLLDHAAPLMGAIHRLSFAEQPVTAGGVRLDFPLILAAGLIKGDGFASEREACEAVMRGRNIIPGWRALPALLGPTEFGSFTRWPRLGNSGTVVWRDVPTRSTQNRIGLRNPGVMAAAEFLAARKERLPACYGINIAVSPGVDDPAEQTAEVVAGLRAFLDRGVRPSWFTINLSCPNTEDDPNGHQTAEQAALLCGAAVQLLRPIPLWVKIGPTLAGEQYDALMQVFAEVGVSAVIATNTLPMPASDNANLTAGIAGGRLHARAVEIAARLVRESARNGGTVDVIGCGGILDGASCHDFARVGVRAMQYWSALVYRGPLAAAQILHEATR